MAQLSFRVGSLLMYDGACIGHPTMTQRMIVVEIDDSSDSWGNMKIYWERYGIALDSVNRAYNAVKSGAWIVEVF